MERPDARILVVDDIAHIRNLIKLFLTRNEFLLVQEASDGVQAMKMFAEFKPDLIILDLMLPKVSGMDLIDFFVDKDPDVKILIASALDTQSVKEDTIQRGALDYITKPISEKILIGKINELLSSDDAIAKATINKLVGRDDTKDFSKKLGIKLDMEKSLQILNAYGVLDEEEFNNIKKTIISLQMYDYSNIILNFNGISSTKIDLSRLTRFRELAKQKNGQLVIITVQNSLRDQLVQYFKKEMIVKTEPEAVNVVIDLKAF